MSLTTNSGRNLDDHYRDNPSSDTPCDNSTRTHWWGFTPYDFRETMYYIYKMLVLPGLITAIVIVLLIMGVYENIIIGTISTILTYIGSLLFSIYIRERRRERRFAIPDDELITENSFNLNEISETKFRIGFVGDIMRMRDFELIFSNNVVNFFNGVNIIIGNLEGIVTDRESFAKQFHPDKILQQLTNLLGGNTRWLICLSNNHSIDFGNQEFHNSLHTIQKVPEIDVFGRNDVPHVIVGGVDINISTASEWSNQKTWNCISKFRDTEIDSYNSQERFNILYPHWGYESERYVRTGIQNTARDLLTNNSNLKWDLIFGQHPHVRQPIMKVRDENIWKLVAYSGGNFTSGVTFLRRSKHIHGIIMKCDIGPLRQDSNQLVVGRVEWQNVFNKEDESRNVPTKVVEFGTEEPRSYILTISIVIIVLFIVLKILDFFL